MDIYEATQAILTQAVPQTNVSAYVLQYDEDKDQFILPEFPAVTYNYTGIVPIVAHDGSSNLFRIDLTVEVWGDLEQIDANARKVTETLNAKRTTVGNVEFTTVCMEATDISELGLDFKRRRMRFVGLAEIWVTNG